MSKHIALACALSGIGIVASPAFAGPEWIERDDAGPTLPTAQKTLGVGPLNGISGMLGTNDGLLDFEDMYLITVINPAIFSITLDEADFDAQLFVFNVTLPGEAFGLLGNDNTAIGNNAPTILPMSNDGSGAQLTLPGVYAIAVSASGHNPISATGSIFNFASPTEISGPDGPGGTNPHIGWSGEGDVGSYRLILTGVGFYDVPSPGAMALMTIAGAIAVRRRRR